MLSHIFHTKMAKIITPIFCLTLLSACSKDPLDCSNPEALSKISEYYQVNTENTVQSLGGDNFILNLLYPNILSYVTSYGGSSNDVRKPEPSDYKKIKYSVSNIRVVEKDNYKIQCKADIISTFNKSKAETPIDYIIEKYVDKSGFHVQQTKFNNELMGSLLGAILIKE